VVVDRELKMLGHDVGEVVSSNGKTLVGEKARVTGERTTRHVY
jgi:cytoskeletal protein CcmA (bactofilin family)